MSKKNILLLFLGTLYILYALLIFSDYLITKSYTEGVLESVYFSEQVMNLKGDTLATHYNITYSTYQRSWKGLIRPPCTISNIFIIAPLLTVRDEIEVLYGDTPLGFHMWVRVDGKEVDGVYEGPREVIYDFICKKQYVKQNSKYYTVRYTCILKRVGIRVVLRPIEIFISVLKGIL